MIKYITLFFLILASPTYAQSEDTITIQDEVLTPVETLLSGITSKDVENMKTHVQSGATMTISDERRDHSVRISFDDWYAQIATATASLQETMPNPTVKIDGNIAMVWGYYRFEQNGQLSHCGINHFSLTRDNGQWKIANLAFSIRRTNCEEHNI